MGNYYLYLFAYHLTRALPLSVAYALGVALADCHYALSKTDRRCVESNLKVLLKSDTVDPQMVRDVFRNFGRYLVEFFTMTKHLTPEFIKKHIRVKGLEYVDEVLKYGKGCIITSAHFGNWEMAAAGLSKLGYPLAVVALQHKDSRVNKLFNDQREFFGTTVIPTTTAVRRCIEQLKDNRLVAILAERDFSNKGLVMDFLGRPTMIPRGSALFSLRTGAPIITCFYVRKPDGTFEAEFNKPIYPPVVDADGITDEHIKNLIIKYMSVTEEELRKEPTQWLNFKEFWIS